jgi:hypothetical protein
LQLHKALVAVQQSPTPALLVVDRDKHCIERVFSHTDCLQAVLNMEDDPSISEKTLDEYMRSQEKMMLLTGDAQLRYGYCFDRV